MNNSSYLCYVKMIDAAIRRQAPDENGEEIRSRLLFLRDISFYISIYITIEWL